MLRAVLDRPVSVVIASLALVTIGFFSLLKLPVSLLPTLERPRLQVTLTDVERSREELAQLVVEPLERRFLSLQGVVDVTSAIDDGRGRLTLETEWQTDVDRLRIDAERRLGNVAGLGLDYEFVVESGDRGAILEIAVHGGVSAHARTLFADDVLIPELGRLAGAGQVRRFGGALTRPVVRPHAAALAARGLTPSDLVERLEGIGQSQPAGRLRDGARVRPMFFRDPVASLEELRALRLRAPGLGESATTLGEVAGVELEEVADTSSFRWNGQDAVLVELHRAPGANAVMLAREARRAIGELSGRLDRQEAAGPSGAGLAFEVVRDASLEVVEALTQLALAGVLGLALGTLVMRWMLGSWRPTLALMVVVPASLVAAFGGFYLWDVSLDVVSLAGLALAAGMLVDNSIVVLEAIERARSRRREEPGEDFVYRGTRQITLALIASFLTTAVVFVPLIYLRGLARAFFGVQAFAIVTALAVSLVLSLALTPVLSRRLTAGQHKAERGRQAGRRLYLALLERSLRHPWLVLTAAVALLAAGASLVPVMPRELVPDGPARALSVDYRLPSWLDAEQMRRNVREIEERLLRAAGQPLSTISLYRGRGGDRTFAEEVDRGHLDLVYPDAASLEEAQAALEQELERLPGVTGALRLRRGAVAAALERLQNRVEVEASATSPARARQLAGRLADHLAATIGVEAKPISQDGSEPRRGKGAFVLDWDDFRFAQLEADPAMVARQVRHGLGGFHAGRLDIEGIEAEILVETTRPTDPRLLPVRPVNAALTTASPSGSPTTTGSPTPQVMPLAAVAKVERRLEPPALERSNARPAVRLALGASNSVSPDRVAGALNNLPLAVDEEVRLVGQAQEVRRSFAQLEWALGLALLLVFLTVAALYESLAMPLVVMTTVPVAAAGALGLLQALGQSLNVMSLLGLILLAGIVVNNAIVLVHRIEQRTASGHEALIAIRLAAEERYRPIVMTTVTTLLGMIPLAALGGEGLELRRALAVAVSGGLVTSLFAALFVVPVLHRTLIRRRHRQGESV